MARPLIERMMIKTRKNTSGCWEWIGAKNNAGYGMVRDDPEYLIGMITAHRAMARHIGIDIYNNEIQHICLNKSCVNPDHLTTGDVRDRTDRLMIKYGNNYIKCLNPYWTCDVCGKTTYMTWFSRKHKNCINKI